MDIFRARIQRHRTIVGYILFLYTIFQGCFSFPFANELFPFSLSKAIIILVGYGVVGMCFAGLIEKGKEKNVFLMSFGFTVVGLICRFALEYGEVSNAMNFTPLNIFLYLVVVPLYCTAIYWGIHKWESGQKET